MINKENYLKISKMVDTGCERERINAEFDAARAAMDSVDVAVSSNEQIPNCFRVAWDSAYEELSTSVNCRPETQLNALKECLDVIEYFEWKHYM